MRSGRHLFLIILTMTGLASSAALAQETRQVNVDMDGIEAELSIPLTPKSELSKMDLQRLVQMFEQTQRASVSASAFPTLKEFSYESAVFFAAIGALNTAKILKDYDSNPALMQQHFDELGSPIAHLSFYHFMVANRLFATRATFFRKYTPVALPYLSMSAGMIASQLTSVLLTPLSDCSTALVEKRENRVHVCQKAWDQLVVSDVIFDLIPSITNMLAASYASKFLEQSVAKFSRGQSVKILLQAALVPFQLLPVGKLGSFGVKALAATKKAAVGGNRALVFLSFSDIFHPWIQQPLVGLKESVLAKQSRFPEYQNLISSHFYTKDKKSLPEILDGLKKVILSWDHWKAFKLADVFAAHSQWELKLDQLARKSLIMEKFYRFLTEKIKSQREGGVDDFRTVYLAGIKGAKNAKENLTDEQYMANTTERFRQRNLEIAAGEIQIFENSKNFKLMTDTERNFFSNFRSVILSKDKIKIANLMADIAYKQKSMSWRTSLGPIAVGQWRMVENRLGISETTTNPGQGLLEAFARHPEHSELMKGLTYGEPRSKYKLSTYSDYLVYQMICGPDAGQNNFIRGGTLFSDDFSTPRLIPAQAQAPDFCNYGGPQLPNERMYADQITVEYQGKVLNFKGALDVIASLAPDSRVTDFENWFGLQVRGPIGQFVLSNYKPRYQKIVGQLLEKFQNKNASTFADKSTYGLPHRISDIYRQKYLVLMESFSLFYPVKPEDFSLRPDLTHVIHLFRPKVPEFYHSYFETVDEVLKVLETSGSSPSFKLSELVQVLESLKQVDHQISENLSSQVSNSAQLQFWTAVAGLIQETTESLKTDLLMLNTVDKMTESSQN